MRILINNLLESATLTATGTNTIFPLTNIYEGALTDRAQFDDDIVIDMGSAKAVNSVAFSNTTHGITLEGNATDSWGAPTYSKVLTESVTFISETFRYWRIVTSATSRIGYFYLGEYLQISDTTGKHEALHNKTDIKNPTSSSVIYPTNGINYKTEVVDCPLVFDSERTSFLTWWDSLDRALNHFIVRFEDNISKYPPYYGNILAAPFERDRGTYEYKLTIQESK